MKKRRISLSPFHSFSSTLPLLLFALFCSNPLFAESGSSVYGPPPPSAQQQETQQPAEADTGDSKKQKKELKEFEKKQKEFGSKKLFGESSDEESNMNQDALTGEERSKDYTPNFLSLALWTLVIIAGIVLVFFLIKKYLPATRRLFSQPGIEVLSQLPLNQSGTIYLLKVGDRILRVGATNEEITYMGEIEDPEEVARLKSECSGSSEPSRDFSETFDSVRERSGTERDREQSGEGNFPSPFGQLNDELSNLHSIINSWKRSS